METARRSGRPANEVYRDLRAGAESGWDYSSRWLRDCNRLASIRTTQFVPVDLNAFMYKLENTIANISALNGDREVEAEFRVKASERRSAVTRYLWDDEQGCYRDYDWRREQMALFSAASVVPLYVGTATHEQADRLDTAIRTRLLTPAVFWQPNTTAANSGTFPTAGRRCSGWRSVASSCTATMRWATKSPAAG